MNLRRKLSTSAAVVAVIATIVLGAAAPASAGPLATIPSCSTMLTSSSTPDYWATFATINGDTAVRYTPTTPLYGTSSTTLKGKIRDWGGRSCSWRLSHAKSDNFTVSETRLTKARASALRNWYSSHGIVAVDSEATLGGVSYQVSPTEMALLMHDSVWITIKARNTDVFGYTLQAASYRIAELNPWIAGS